MKFTDISSSVLIIVVFILLYFVEMLSVGLKKLEDDWPKHRCNPSVMPFAGYLGHDIMENFTFCVGNIQKDMMDFFLGPIRYILTMVGDLGKWILERIQWIREFINYLRGMVTAVVGDIYSMFINVLIQFQKLVIKLKDTIMKLIGLIMTFIYLIQGAVLTGQSIQAGPIGKVLRALCFNPNTIVKLKNGKHVMMKDINLGDVLENGSEVIGCLKLKGSEHNPYYKIWSKKLNNYIYVTGEHKILPDEKRNIFENYINVSDYKNAEKTTLYDNEYSCLITHDHRIPVGEYTFWDWED